MINNKYISNSLNETIQIGKDLALTLDKGVVISLSGDLGVGKTAFTKGIALGLGIEEAITSPTFTLLKEYEGRLNLKHIDAYRLENMSSDTLGIYDLIDETNVVVLEWAQFLNDSDIHVDIKVEINYVDENTREITVEEIF